MIGGYIIENVEGNLNGTLVRRLWVMDRNGDECCVYVDASASVLSCGEQIWWQSNLVFACGDALSFRKIAYSFQPQE